MLFVSNGLPPPAGMSRIPKHHNNIISKQTSQSFSIQECIYPMIFKATCFRSVLGLECIACQRFIFFCSCILRKNALWPMESEASDRICCVHFTNFDDIGGTSLHSRSQLFQTQTKRVLRSDNYHSNLPLCFGMDSDYYNGSNIEIPINF